MHEDKQKICDLLLPALQATYDASDLVALEYSYIESEDKEIVAARFSGGGIRRINVSMDSGTAMIRDIMKNLGC